MTKEEELKQAILRDLPALLRSDPELRAWVLAVTNEAYADRQRTESRFDRLLDELRRDREEQSRKWEEQSRKWEEQNRKWEEQNRKWETLRIESDRRWEKADQRFEQLHQEIMEQAKKHDRSIGALGARWGMQAESTFRNALAGILEENFGVNVRHVDEYDDEGEVFGRPDQVELDIIIYDGQLLICELKSSIDKAGMYSFERKARFYERKHGRKATRLLVISPMVDPRAQKVAERLGIETYSDSIDVKTL
ncbi:MAG: DUF3782 domain-containing protein [Gammaproteobacteria bacterium]|jgi:hypothetical protein|nr:DUF3782 domain-containing protein [Gammaproteobacteria bacterium]